MKPNEENKHYALQSKSKTKRLTSLPDQAKLALQMKAANLEDSGNGGGIAETLLPKTKAERIRLNRIAETNDVVLVRSRSGTSENPPDRVGVRSKVADDDLMAQLAVEFGRSVGMNPRPQQGSIQNFVNWLSADVAAKGPAYTILVTSSRELIDETDEAHITLRRGQGWWIDQITLRRKKLR